MVYGTNLLNSVPDRERTIEALKALEFVVAIDVLPQEHIAWADVVLPEATYLERYEDLWTVPHKTPYIALARAGRRTALRHQARLVDLP